MPAKSEKQRKAAGMALSAKRGKTDPGELKGAAKEMYESMTEKELKAYAEKSASAQLLRTALQPGVSEKLGQRNGFVVAGSLRDVSLEKEGANIIRVAKTVGAKGAKALKGGAKKTKKLVKNVGEKTEEKVNKSLSKAMRNQGF